MAIDNFSSRTAGMKSLQGEGQAPAPKVTILGGATRIIPSNGVVVLPADVSLDNIRVLGRDLVVNLPDGSQIVIVDGAITVPQIVIGEVELPAANVAALLIGQEPQPAAGAPSSGGGNFSEDPGTIGDPFGLGDLLPPTELAFSEPEVTQIFEEIPDEQPTIDIEVDDSGVSVINAADVVREAGLPARGLESEGSDSGANSEATFGFINITVPDAPGSVTINGTAITTVGQTITTANGILTIVSIDPGQIGYTYLLTDNTLGATSDNFTVVVTDADGDSATATLRIDIVDDAPLALDDNDNIASGEFGPATGNVITDSEADGGRDTQGADGATVSGVASNNIPANVDTTATAGAFVVVGQYGTLTINTDGSYSYVRAEGSAGGVTDVFTYTLTDGDGDSDTATLTINIEDAEPLTGENAAVQLDDDALTGGNPGGIDDVTPDTANTTGTLAGEGGDGALTFALSDLGAPTGFTYELDNGNLLIKQGTTTVITVTLDTATGNYTVTQNAPIDHEAGLDENDQAFTISYQISDADGDTANGTLDLSVNDDSPTIDVTAGTETGVILTTQDADTIDTASDTATSTANFGGVFGLTQNAGADGLGTAGVLSYDLNVTNSVSGLESHDVAINLYDIGGKIVGSTATVVDDVTTGNTIFDLAVSSTGVVTLTQYQQIDHAVEGTTTSPFDDQFAILADNKISLTASATITDFDGDTATDSATVDLGGNIKFADHGPTIDLTIRTTSLVVDESVGTTGSILNEGGATNNDETTTVATNDIGFAKGFLFDVTTANAGADGLGSQVYSLSLGSAGLSGLMDSDTNQNVLLTLVNGVIEGRTATSNALVFTLSISSTSGEVSLTQFRAIEHNDSLNHDENGVSAAVLLANAVSLNVTLTDFDGDTASDTLDISGLIKFEDDGPAVLSSTGASLVNSGTFSGTGDFIYDIGSDFRAAPSTTNSDFQSVILSGTINGATITPSTLTRVSETLTTAVFSFSFTYSGGLNQTLTNTGTITFNKADGKYTVDLADQLQGTISIGTTSASNNISGYELGTSTPDSTSPVVAVTQVLDDVFIQFRGESVSGSNSLLASARTSYGDNSDAGDTSFVNGEVLTGNSTWVSVSGGANGVAGDTIGKGEVLDMDFFVATPTGLNIETTASTQATVDNVFFKLDGVGSNEDFIVVLKLYDTVTLQYTTKAVIVKNEDIWKGPGTGPEIYSSVTLDNNDGLVIIESNDYNTAGSHYVIVGMQIVSDNGSLTGDAINLDKTIGATSASTFDANLSDDINDTGFKVSDIGLVQINVAPATGSLSFNVTLVDTDLDTTSQTLTATVTPIALDMDHDGQVSYVGLEAGVHYDYAGDGVAESTAWVAGNDGLLALLNEDGSYKISFATHEGQTDLEGLAQVYDSNQDGVLDANDAAFAGFGVWQDANQDGVVNEGEFQSLTDEGIVSLDLVSDGQASTAADGDVIIFGTSSYTTNGGNTYDVDDVGFVTVTTTATNDNNELEKTSINGSISNALLAASLIAMVESDDSDAQPVAADDQSTEKTLVSLDTSFAPADDATTDQPSADIDGKLLTGLDVSAEHAEPHAQVSDADDHPALSGLDVAADTNAAPVIAELLSDTDISPSIFHFAQSVSIDAPSTVAIEAVLVQQAAAPAQVSEVVADALSGGTGEGPNIDHVLDLLTGSTGQADAGALLSSLGGEAGAIADMFGGAHLNFADTMDHLAMTHPDAHTSVMG